MNDNDLVLASASPRRYAIAARLVPAVRVIVPRCTEIHNTTQPEITVRENAWRKCGEVQARTMHAYIIAADTVVFEKHAVLGKPGNMQEATEMLRSLSGTSHRVYTGTALAVPGGAIRIAIDCSTVVFRDLNNALIERYFMLVNPLDKAGGYDIAQHGDLLIDHYEGSFTNIMGLSEERIAPWLTHHGFVLHASVENDPFQKKGAHDWDDNRHKLRKKHHDRKATASGA